MVAAAASWGLSAVLTKVSLQQLAPLDLFGIERLFEMLSFHVRPRQTALQQPPHRDRVE